MFHCPEESPKDLRSPKVAKINETIVDVFMMFIVESHRLGSWIINFGWGLWRPDMQRPLEGGS